ncbi:uncharacterized protein RJT20DRAFT_136536 [Scheffersomyces xylosifermentans]|uniref:uncharacterized protein n=1 Tax=Scheffersomyces xylosifermentans TaxID=1304137 RepID=UPI00315C9139
MTFFSFLNALTQKVLTSIIQIQPPSPNNAGETNNNIPQQHPYPVLPHETYSDSLAGAFAWPTLKSKDFKRSLKFTKIVGHKKREDILPVFIPPSHPLPETRPSIIRPIISSLKETLKSYLGIKTGPLIPLTINPSTNTSRLRKAIKMFKSRFHRIPPESNSTHAPIYKCSQGEENLSRLEVGITSFTSQTPPFPSCHLSNIRTDNLKCQTLKVLPALEIILNDPESINIIKDYFKLKTQQTSLCSGKISYQNQPLIEILEENEPPLEVSPTLEKTTDPDTTSFAGYNLEFSLHAMEEVSGGIVEPMSGRSNLLEQPRTLAFGSIFPIPDLSCHNKTVLSINTRNPVSSGRSVVSDRESLSSCSEPDYFDTPVTSLDSDLGMDCNNILETREDYHESLKQAYKMHSENPFFLQASLKKPYELNVRAWDDKPKSFLSEQHESSILFLGLLKELEEGHYLGHTSEDPSNKGRLTFPMPNEYVIDEDSIQKLEEIPISRRIKEEVILEDKNECNFFETEIPQDHVDTLQIYDKSTPIFNDDTLVFDVYQPKELPSISLVTSLYFSSVPFEPNIPQHDPERMESYNNLHRRSLESIPEADEFEDDLSTIDGFAMAPTNMEPGSDPDGSVDNENQIPPHHPIANSPTSKEV